MVTINLRPGRKSVVDLILSFPRAGCGLGAGVEEPKHGLLHALPDPGPWQLQFTLRCELKCVDCGLCGSGFGVCKFRTFKMQSLSSTDSSDES